MEPYRCSRRYIGTDRLIQALGIADEPSPRRRGSEAARFATDVLRPSILRAVLVVEACLERRLLVYALGMCPDGRSTSTTLVLVREVPTAMQSARSQGSWKR
jgi:hypothetical protein